MTENHHTPIASQDKDEVFSFIQDNSPLNANIDSVDNLMQEIACFE